jgi:ANTAR domain
MSGTTAPGETVVRRSAEGWVVGDQEASDLTSAMVLADLLAADLVSSGARPGPGGSTPAGHPGAAETDQNGTPGSPAPKPAPRHARPPTGAAAADEVARLAVTVTQLEHALTARVRVEQAIGVLAERHRLRTRDAFDLLRSAARARGRRVIDIAEDVVSSTSNPLLRLPEELERKPEPRARIRSSRRSHAAG